MAFNNAKISRQLDIINPFILQTPITVIGCGAVGSWTTLALAKMGFTNIHVLDFDDVDEVNMSSQLFTINQYGINKAKALYDNILFFTGTKITYATEPYEPSDNDKLLSGVIIPAVDSMRVRKQLFESIRVKNRTIDVIIDPRMGAEIAKIFTINPNMERDRITYEKVLFSDEDAYQAPCTAKSTTYCSLVLSGLVAQTVADYLQNKNYSRCLTFSMTDKILEVQKGL